MFSWFHRVRPLLALAAIAAVGCSDGQAPAVPDGTTRFSVLLKDAPGDIQAAVVTIDEVQLVGEGGVMTLTDAPTTVDLLTLADTTAALVTNAVVPSGSYTELRFVISGGYIEVEQPGGGTSIYASSPDYAGLPEGATVDGTLQMPSLAQSGLKVKLTPRTLDLMTDQKIVLVDFDVAKSFGHGAGRSGMWVMHPVITGGDIQVSGSVDANVRLGEGVELPEGVTLADLSATLTNTATLAETTLPLTDGDDDGVFTASFLYLAPGGYTVTLVVPPEVSSLTTVPAIPVAVAVVSDQASSVDITITEVTASGSVDASVQLDEGVTLPEGVTLADFSATLTNTVTLAETTLPLTDGDDDGVFTVSYPHLAPGSYTLTLVPPASVASITTNPAEPVAVEVIGEQTAPVNVTITAVTVSS